MLEAAALLSLYLAFALLHAAASGRRAPGGPQPSIARRRAFQVAALAAGAAGVELWARADGPAAALLVALAALLGIRDADRAARAGGAAVVWSAALACAPAAPALAIAGCAVAEPGPARGAPVAPDRRRLGPRDRRAGRRAAGGVLGAICAGRSRRSPTRRASRSPSRSRSRSGVLAACALALARSGVRAWLWCGRLTLALGGLALGAPL